MRPLFVAVGYFLFPVFFSFPLSISFPEQAGIWQKGTNKRTPDHKIQAPHVAQHVRWLGQTQWHPRWR
jgi:hypothetical protein